MAAPLAKILLFTFNFFLFCNGTVLLSFGIMGVANPTALSNFLWWIPGVTQIAVIINIPSVIVSSAVFMIVLGSIMVVFGFLGCGGVVCSSKWLLFFYWILLIAVMIVEIALIIYAAVSPNAMANYAQKVMYTSLHDNFQPVTITGNAIRLPPNIYAVSWVAMQFEVGCCGVVNATDYTGFTWNNTVTLPNGNSVNALVPPSCCKMTGPSVVPKNSDVFVDLPACLSMQSSYNTQGCYSSVNALMVQFSYIPIGSCVAVVCIEIVCIILAIYLWKLKSHKRGGAA